MQDIDNLPQTEIIRPRRSTQHVSEAEFDRTFKPHGAMAFFVLLVILGAIIWFGIYFLMLKRA